MERTRERKEKGKLLWCHTSREARIWTKFLDPKPAFSPPPPFYTTQSCVFSHYFILDRKTEGRRAIVRKEGCNSTHKQDSYGNRVYGKVRTPERSKSSNSKCNETRRSFWTSRRHLEHFPVLDGLKVLTEDWSLHKSQNIIGFGE